MATTENTSLSYLSLDPKYFQLNQTDRFLITKYDINHEPILMDYVRLSQFDENGDFDFTDYSIVDKDKIAKIYYRNYELLILKDNNLYLDSFKFLEIAPDDQELIDLFNSVDITRYYKDSPLTGYIKYSTFSDSDKLKLMKVFFFNKNKLLEIREHKLTTLATLTDIDLNLNKYTVIMDIKKFFFNIFFNWLSTSKGSIPFSSGYYSSVKDMIQVKNETVLFEFLKNEFTAFFNDIGLLYEASIEVIGLDFINTQNIDGSDSITINITMSFNEDNILVSLQV